MRMLLDSHAFLWFVLNDPQLSQTAKAMIEDPNNDIEISPASYWELAIKFSMGDLILRVKDPYPVFVENEIQKNDFAILPIEVKHVGVVSSLPFHHKDPFDRMLIAQAMTENIPIISNDALFDKYPITRLW